MTRKKRCGCAVGFRIATLAVAFVDQFPGGILRPGVPAGVRWTCPTCGGHFEAELVVRVAEAVQL